MEIYRRKFKNKEQQNIPRGVALGNFDGIHKGHAALIKALVENCKRNNLSSCVYTFENHPFKVLDDEKMNKALQLIRKFYVYIGARMERENAMKILESDDPKAVGAPEYFYMHVRDLVLYNGAAFVTVLMGNIMTMPGLPKVPSAEKIDVDDDGVITGLF